MKTLRIMLLLLVVMVTSSSYGFTKFSIPFANNNLKVRADNLRIISLLVPIDFKGFEVFEPKSTLNYKPEDTIFIELPEIVINSDFPGSALECIKRQIPYPAFASSSNLEGGVMVCFAFNEEGVIKIRGTSSSHPLFEAYVIEKLKNIHLNNCEVEIGRSYYMRFLFKIL